MIKIKKATEEHVEDIAKVCTEAFWVTYRGMQSDEHIERVTREFYNHERILSEVTTSTRGWNGYYVAVEGGKVIGAGGGGMTGEHTGEVFVLYLDPVRRNEGIGTRLLEAITEVHKTYGAMAQWVSVLKGNQKGIPFYEAKGFSKQSERPGYGNTPEGDYMSLRYWREI